MLTERSIRWRAFWLCAKFNHDCCYFSGLCWWIARIRQIKKVVAQGTICRWSWGCSTLRWVCTLNIHLPDNSVQHSSIKAARRAARFEILHGPRRVLFNVHSLALAKLASSQPRMITPLCPPLGAFILLVHYVTSHPFVLAPFIKIAKVFSSLWKRGLVSPQQKLESILLPTVHAPPASLYQIFLAKMLFSLRLNI